MFTNDTMKGRKNMINAKKIIASAVFFASLLGSLAFKPTIEKNKPLFEANRALNNLLSVEKYVEADSDKSPLDKTAGLLDPKKEREKEEDEDSIFVVDKEKLAHYLDRKPSPNSYIDAFKEIKADLFQGKTRAELLRINQAINECSEETIESKLFLNSVFDNTYTAENIEEKMVELSFDTTPSIMAPYNSLAFDFDEWLLDHNIDLEYKSQILEGDFSDLPEGAITVEPTRYAATATMICVGGSYFAESGLISFIMAKIGSLFSVISGAIKSFIAVVNIPWVGWALAAAIIVALTVIIILNWSKIVACFEHIKAWFIYKAAKFAAKITSLFSSMASQGADRALDDAAGNALGKGNPGGWSKSQLKSYLKKCLRKGLIAIALEEFFRNTKYVYLGRWKLPENNDNKDYVKTAKNEDGLYYFVDESVDTYIRNNRKSDYWTLNIAFVEFCLISGKLFKLCSRPSLVYDKSQHRIVNNCSYAKELNLIHNKSENHTGRSVEWYGDTPIITTFEA